MCTGLRVRRAILDTRHSFPDPDGCLQGSASVTSRDGKRLCSSRPDFVLDQRDREWLADASQRHFLMLET